MALRRFTLAVVWGVAAFSSPVTRAQLSPQPVGCVTSDCHDALMSVPILHAPVAWGKCESCHALVDEAAHRFRLTGSRSRLCASCHVQSHRTFIHEPVSHGDCTGCHNPHGGDRRFFLVEDPAAGLCLKCHPADEYAKKKHVHGPVAAGACIACHESHSSWYPGLLAAPADRLCEACHAEVQEQLAKSRHVHEPVRDGRCLGCHDAHASDYPGQLRSVSRDLCMSCHEHEPFRRRVATASHVHGALTGEESCTACHAGHGGLLPKLLTEPVMDLCLRCHAESMDALDGRTLTDMATLLRDNPEHHGPVRRADCSACHDPHAASHFSLLDLEYPKTFYAPFDVNAYRLCFSCHFTELATARGGIGVTGFRDGSRNLHFVHVNKPDKGRTCRTCHEVHASKRPFHVREAVPFGAGGWAIDINFAASPEGGRCAPGCHEAQSYRR